jgi:hypothetical protein
VTDQPVGAPPSFNTASFTCPHCGVVAQQNWASMLDSSKRADSDIMRSNCTSCRRHSYWAWEQLVAPAVPLGPPPNTDLTGELLEMYTEAREIAGRSPRAAAALLRMLVEHLVMDLDTEGHEAERLSLKIIRLHEAGHIDDGTRDALMAVKVAGDDALHSGQIDPNAENQAAIVEILFEVVNHIVASTRTLHRKVAELRQAQDQARSEKGRRIAEQKRKTTSDQNEDAI